MQAEDRGRIALSRDRHMEADTVGLYARVLNVYRHRFSISPTFASKPDMETGNGDKGTLLRIYYNSVLRLPQQIHLSWRFSETVNDLEQ